MRVNGTRLLFVTSLLACVGLVIAGTPALAASGPEPPHIVATQAIVVDAGTGDILFDKDARSPVAPASLTKLFTAVVAAESVPLDRMMTVDESALVGEASMGLTAGERIPFETLLNGMLLASGNDAAMTVAENIGALVGDTARQAVDRFLDRANARIAELGLRETHLVNPHGLDQDGHVSSARDIAAITRYVLLHHPAISQILGAQTYRGHGHTLQQTNELLGRYPGLVGGKTGFTQDAGYCLVEIAQRGDFTIIVVLMGSTSEAWYRDAAALLDFGFATVATPGTPRYGTLAPAMAELVPASSVPDATTSVVDETTTDGQHVVSPSAGFAARSRSSLRWVGAALVGVGMIALSLDQTQRAWRRVRSRRHARLSRRPATAKITTAPVGWETHTQPLPTIPAWRPVGDVEPVNSARAYANRGVTLAGQQHFDAAARAFYDAARLDHHFDLTSTPGFWSLCPRGHSAAARALIKAGRLTDARSLAVVLNLGR